MGEVWTRKLVQTLFQTYLRCTRDRFEMGFAHVFWSKLSQTLSKALSRKSGPVSYRSITLLRLVTHFKSLFVGVDQKMVTKRFYNCSPGLILGAFCTIFRARPVGTGLGAKFGRKPAKNQIQHLISMIYPSNIIRAS